MKFSHIFAFLFWFVLAITSWHLFMPSSLGWLNGWQVFGCLVIDFFLFIFAVLASEHNV